MTNNISERKFVVQNLIPANSLTVFTGDVCVGKTTNMVSLSHSLATGTNFAGLQTEKQHCHLLAPEGKADTNQIFVACNKSIQDGGDCRIYDMLIKINTEVGIAQIKSLLLLNAAENDREPITIFIDNADLFVEHSDSFSRDYGEMMRALRQLLREHPEVSFVVSIHSGESPALMPHADGMYKLSKTESKGQNVDLTITPRITRFGTMPEPITMKFGRWENDSKHGAIPFIDYRK